MTQPQERERWGDPNPAILFAVAILTFSLAAILTERVPGSCAPLMIGWLFVLGVAIIIGGIILFKKGDVRAATFSMVFGAVGIGGAFSFWIRLVAWPLGVSFASSFMATPRGRRFYLPLHGSHCGGDAAQLCSRSLDTLFRHG